MADDVILNIKERGARAAARGVDQVDKSVGRLGTSSRASAKHTTLLGRATRGLTSPLRSLEKEAIGAAKGVAAFGLAFGSVEGVKHAIETTDSLVKTTIKLHQQFGLTTQAASGLAGVLQARDIDPAALNMGLVTLSKQLVAAEHGTKKAQGGLRLLGLRARDVHKAVGSRDGLSNVFETVVDRMSRMPGSARKAALGQQLLGRASRGLAPLLQEGALGLSQQLKWAKEYGVTLDGHTIKSVEQMVAAQTQAQYAMLGLQIQLGQFAAPTVAKANVTLAEIVKSFRDGRPEGNKFARTVYHLGEDLKPVGHDLAVVGGYLKDHPKLLRAAALGYVAYRLKLLHLIAIAPKAYLQGLAAGRAFVAGYETGTAGLGAASAAATGATGAAEAAGAGAGSAGRIGQAVRGAGKVFLPIGAGVAGAEIGHALRQAHDAAQTRAEGEKKLRAQGRIQVRLANGTVVWELPRDVRPERGDTIVGGRPRAQPPQARTRVHVTSSDVVMSGRKVGKVVHQVAVDDRARG